MSSINPVNNNSITVINLIKIKCPIKQCDFLPIEQEKRFVQRPTQSCTQLIIKCPQNQAHICLFDFVLYVHGKQLRSCVDGHIS